MGKNNETHENNNAIDYKQLLQRALEEHREQYTKPVVMGSEYRMPESFSEYYGGELMSNSDREINKETEQAIKGKELFSTYSGRNFLGMVWWQDNKWLCEVWFYGCFRKAVVYDTLEDIMTEVSDSYGYD